MRHCEGKEENGLLDKRKLSPFRWIGGFSKVAHKRSEVSLQRRAAQKYILDTSFHDPIMAETISRTNFDAVVTFLGQKFPMVLPEVATVLKGEVLADSRGRGSFQK